MVALPSRGSGEDGIAAVGADGFGSRGCASPARSQLPLGVPRSNT